MVDASTVASAAKWIASSLVKEGQHLCGVEDVVRDLHTDLECMGELLQIVDADPSLIQEDGQELAFLAEDAIDTYVVDVGAGGYMKKTFLVKFACLLSLSYPLLVLRKEIEAIKQEILKAKEIFEIFGMIVQPQNASQSFRCQKNYYIPSENYIHLDEVVVVIDDVVSQLVKRLIDPDDDSEFLESLELEGQRIFKQIKGDPIPFSESELVKELHDFIKYNKCLVVLDDIWKKEAWDDIYPIFPHMCEVDYKVILTTRKEEVPLQADNKCIIHQPKLLIEDQKWALFSKVAIEGRPQIEKNSDDYEKLGRQMLEKLQGLPLAVVTLVGILRTKRELYEWEDISKACRGNILKGKGSPSYGGFEDMLELSYLDLPTHLKLCFLYLAIFLEDYYIRADWMIQLWVAKGFITSDLLGKEQETLEDAGMCSLY